MTRKLFTYSKLRWLFLTLFILFSVLIALQIAPWWSFLVLLLLWIGVLAYGSFVLSSCFFLSSVSKGRSGTLALTFDDGPHPEFTPKLLDLLKQQKVRATFFCIGRHVENYPDTAQRIIAEGHLIGNHTQNHLPTWGWLWRRHLIDQIEQCQRTIEHVTGARPMFFRPPYGVTNPRIAKVLAQTGLTTVGWDWRTLDTRRRTTNHMADRLASKGVAGTLVVLHDTHHLVVEHTRMIIEKCRTQGIALVRSDDVLDH